MAAPDPFKPMPAATAMVRAPQEFGLEADFADLAARFAAKSGGGLSPELSAELALEIVLNEIVEQACQVTGATGAAIILERDGQLSCRAGSGSTGPQLGSCVDSSGLAGECLHSHKTLWCDDTFTDPRAEADLFRQLGVRSVVIMPLLRNDSLIGLFELLSPQPYAFGVRDERTLEMLAERTVANLEHVAEPDAPPATEGPAADLQHEDLQRIGLQDVELKNIALESLGLSAAAASHEDRAQSAALPSPTRDLPAEFALPKLAAPHDESPDVKESAKPSVPANAESDFVFPDLDPAEITSEEIATLLANAGVITPEPPRGSQDLVREAQPVLPAAPEPAVPKQVDYVSWALGFAVVSVAILLGLVLGQHFLLSHSYAPTRAASAAPSPTASQRPTDPIQPSSSSTTKPLGDQPKSTARTSRPDRTSTSREPAARSDETVPPGGLVVSENGKEVFRLPPANFSGSAPAHQVVQSASEVDPDSSPRRVVDLPEATAQREVLYRSEPQYPEAARAQNIQGPVVLELHIGTNGSVQNVEVISGPPLLAQASVEAVKQWRFKPRVVNGSPVEMQTRVTFNFKLPQ